ncbi:MAG: hypothetical protein BGN85_08825 [Alphaproteobacteria bacterium 64-11]|nr:MAG: hypothetical protein BGN85_08825 [Alphaproteobacteria bacterium 64-11]
MAEAVDVQRLVAVLEARLDKYEKGLAKALKLGDDTFTKIETRGHLMETRLAGLGKNVSIGLDSTRIMALQHSMRGFTEMVAQGVSPLRALTMEMNNLSYVATGPGGLKAVFNTIKGIGAGVFGPLIAEAGPVAIAFAGVTAAAVGLWAVFSSRGEISAEEALKRQKAYIDALAEAYPNAAKEAKAYIAEIAKLSDAQLTLLGDKSLAGQKSQLDQLGRQIDDIVRRFTVQDNPIANALASHYGPGALFGDAGKQVQDLVAQFDAGTISAKDLAKAMAEIQLDPDTPRAVSAVAEKIMLLAQQGAIAAGTIASINNELSRLAAPPGTQGRGFSVEELLGPQGYTDLTKALKKQASDLTSTRTPHVPKTNAYKSEIQSIEERTAVLNAETHAQAGINPLVDDYGYALSRAKAEQELLSAAQKAGITLTPAMREQIAGLADGYAQASANAEKLAESQDKARQAAEEMRSLEKDVFTGIIDDLRQGKSAGDILVDVLDKIASKFEDILANALFSPQSSFGFSDILSFFTGAGSSQSQTGGVFGLYHSGGVAGNPSQTRSVSPSIFAGAPRYHSGGVAGLRPGEVPAILQRGEVIIPNGGKARTAGSDGGTTVQVINNGSIQSRTERSRGPDGREMVKIINSTVNDHIASGGADKVLSSRFGVRPAGITR